MHFNTEFGKQEIDLYSHLWEVLALKLEKKTTLFWIWEGADIRPQIRPRKIPEGAEDCC